MRTLFTGTYTKKEDHVEGQANGIYTLYQHSVTGLLKKGKTVAEVVNPSFVRTTEDGKFLFAVSELGEKDAASGYIYSFKIQDDDSLKEISRLSTESFAPAHIEIDRTGRYVFVSNYVGGVVMVYRIKYDGSLEKQQRINLDNPQKAHAHSTTISIDNKNAYIADLGNDRIWIFNFDEEEGKLLPATQAFVALEEGTGPRHLALSGNGKFAFSANELNSSITVLKIRPTGDLEVIQQLSSIPEDFHGQNTAADIHIHPSERFLYVSNRGHNSIACFAIDLNSGKAEIMDHVSTCGKTPRNFAFSPEGNFLYVANQDSDNVVCFRIAQDSGIPEPYFQSLQVMTPVCLEFKESHVP